MADDIAGSLSIDIDPFLQGIDRAQAAGEAFSAGSSAWDTVSISVDTSAYDAALQATTAGQDASAQSAADLAAAEATVAESSQTAAGSTAAAATATTEDAQAQAELTQQLQEQVAALQEQVTAQGETISGLQEHTAASGEAAKEIGNLRNETTGLATEALPGLSGSLTAVNGTLGAVTSGIKAASESEMDFTTKTALMGAGLTGAGIGAAAGFFAIFDNGLTTLKLTATQFGLTIPEVAGLRAELQSVGLPATAADMALRSLAVQQTALNTQLEQGKEPSGKLAEGLDKLGISAVDAQGHAKSFESLLPEIFEGFKKTADAATATGQPIEAAGLAADLFGARAGPRMVPALLEGEDGLKHWQAAVEKAGIGSAEQVARLEDLHTATATASVELQGMATKIGSDVAPAVTAGISLVGGLAEKVGELPGPLRDLVVTAPLAAGAILLTVSAGAKLLTTVAEMIPALITRTTVQAAVTASDATMLTADEAVTEAMYAMFAASAEVEAGELLLVTGGTSAAAATTALAAAEEGAAVASTALALTPLGATMLIVAATVGVATVAWSLFGSGADKAKIAEDNLAAATKAALPPIQQQISTWQQAGITSDAIRVKLQGQLDTEKAAAASSKSLVDSINEEITTTKRSMQEHGALSQTYAQGKSDLDAYTKALAGEQLVLTGNEAQVRATQSALDAFNQSQAKAAENADIALTSQQKLAGTLNISTTGALATAAAHDVLTTAVKNSGQSAQNSIIFTNALAAATKDAGLNDADWKERRQQLTELAAGSDPVLKQLADTELALAGVTKALSAADIDAAIAQAQLNDVTAQLSPILQQVAGDVRQAGSQSKQFNKDLVTDGQTSSQAWASQYGAAAQAVAEAFHDSSTKTVSDWRTANGNLLDDEFRLQDAITSKASEADIIRLKNKIDTDRLAQDSALDTANAAIKDEQDYLNAVADSANQQRTLHARIFDDTLKLSHLTVDEQKTDLAKWLAASIETSQQILAIDQQLTQDLSADARAVLEARRKALQDTLADEQERAREASATAAANAADERLAAKDLTAAKREETAAQTAQLTALKDTTSVITELNAVKQAGIELDKSGVDLQKQAVETGALVTASQLAGLHGVTEARRTAAEADLTAARAAQENWAAVAATIDTATGFSTKYSEGQVAAAKAAFTTTQEGLKGSQAQFDLALTAETKAQTAFDQQQQASAQAGITLASARRTIAEQELTASNALTTQQVLNHGRVSAASMLAASTSLQAVRDADAAVLADEQALTADLSVQDRKRLEDRLKTDQGIADDARTTAAKSLQAVTDEVTAANKVHVDSATFARQQRDIELADVQSMNHLIVTSALDRDGKLMGTDVVFTSYVTAANRQRVADYEAANARVLADEAALTQDMTDSERSRLDAVLVVDQGVRDDRYVTAQQGIADEEAYAKATFDAENKILTESTDAFDTLHHLRMLTKEEKQAGLAQWLQAELDTGSQIILLETQLAQTTDAIARASIQNKIDGLENLMGYYRLMLHEAEVTAQDIVNRERAAVSALKGETTSSPTAAGYQMFGGSNYQAPPTTQSPTTAGGITSTTAPTGPTAVSLSGGNTTVAEITIENLMVKNAGIGTLHVQDAVLDAAAQAAVAPNPPASVAASAQPGYAGGGSPGSVTNEFMFDFRGATMTGTPQQNEAMIRRVVNDMLTRGAVLSGRRTT